MPRRARGDTKGMVFHAMNRAVKRATMFDAAWEYAAFENLLAETKKKVPISLLNYCVMPNHWHLILLVHQDGDLSRFMHRLTGTHARRWHVGRGSRGTGAVYQGRFKSIPVQSDDHLLRVMRYVERNALRANLVSDAVDWRWSSLWRRRNFCDTELLDAWPIAQPPDWAALVNEPQTESELVAIREAITRSAPFGNTEWRERTAKMLGLEPSLQPVGRPRRKKNPDVISGEARLPATEMNPDLILRS
jgi:putative transposase